MKRSKMLEVIEDYLFDSTDIPLDKYKSVARGLLFLVETMGMQPPEMTYSSSTLEEEKTSHVNKWESE